MANAGAAAGAAAATYLYKGYRYTKTTMHNKKKSIYCGFEKKYIPIKSLKKLKVQRGGVGDGDLGETCENVTMNILQSMNH